MAGKKQPLAVVQAKGKKHLTKAEIALREARELHPDADKVEPPEWLSKNQKRRFREIAAQLINLKIMTNLDCEALGRLIKAEADYIAISQEIDDQPLMIEKEIYKTTADGRVLKDPDTGDKLMETRRVVNDQREKLIQMQDKLWKQCRQGASDFGLTIAGRCRLVAPTAKEEKPQNKFLKYAKGKQEA